jgi:hypothetical protein
VQPEVQDRKEVLALLVLLVLVQQVPLAFKEALELLVPLVLVPRVPQAYKEAPELLVQREL